MIRILRIYSTKDRFCRLQGWGYLGFSPPKYFFLGLGFRVFLDEYRTPATLIVEGLSV